MQYGEWDPNTTYSVATYSGATYDDGTTYDGTTYDGTTYDGTIRYVYLMIALLVMALLMIALLTMALRRRAGPAPACLHLRTRLRHAMLSSPSALSSTSTTIGGAAQSCMLLLRIAYCCSQNCMLLLKVACCCSELHAAAAAGVSCTPARFSGTSIPVRDSADAYKWKPKATDPDYTFGVRGFWLVAPSRHGAHNWEQVGRLSATRAVDALSALPLGGLAIGARMDPSRLIFSGHSMGGHGAWVAAVQLADRALGVVSVAGWTCKETYGGLPAAPLTRAASLQLLPTHPVSPTLSPHRSPHRHGVASSWLWRFRVSPPNRPLTAPTAPTRSPIRSPTRSCHLRIPPL